MEVVPFSEARSADLRVDAVYQGGGARETREMTRCHIWYVSATVVAFRYRGSLDAFEMVVLTSSMRDPEWPDMLDPETGVFTYYGDNKHPGRGLHETPRKGNEQLRRIFDLAHTGPVERRNVPPILVFANTGEWRDVAFLGLAVPGTADLRASEDLVAIWKASNGKRFQNYRARFSILDVPGVDRAWIADIVQGKPHSLNAPADGSAWIETGRAQSLRATRSIEHRTKVEQLPQNPDDIAIVERIHRYFASDPHGFERCAAALARLLLPDIAAIDLTRPSRDGGRDGIGQLRIGNGEAAILVDFALEAKCYGLSNSVGVREMSRLISRLRRRQFGILVTTSYVDVQAYREIKEDQHPIIILAAADIVALLRNNGADSRIRTHPRIW